MNNFSYYNPTRILFGQGAIAKTAHYIPKNAKVLMLYGGGSIKRTGIYDQVKQALDGFTVLEFGGIEPNPDYATLMQAVQLAREEKVDFLLAVGGGSVIDGTKFIALAIPYTQSEPWDLLKTNAAQGLNEAVPFGTVLTIPGTASEMNYNLVISRRETGEKLSIKSEFAFPRFSALDPQVTYSLSAKQIRNGLVDAFMHVMEQYITYPIGAVVQDRLSESLMQSLIEIAPHAMEIDQPDYTARANFMWAAAMGLNSLVGRGVPQDWATHMIGHELTALYGLAHAESLAAVAPWLLWYKREQKGDKLVQLGMRVFGLISDDREALIEATIDALSTWFNSLGMPTTLTAYDFDPDEAAEAVAKRFDDRGWALGENADIHGSDAAAILRLSR
ncbi:MAG: iron-containing alcohol dehydrogenase [Chloroflexi bacterium]|nr:iron-containing alcohol dehydrogenase [Chloroflexota bacterium]